MFKDLGKNVRAIPLCHTEWSGLNEDSSILSPRQPSLCHVSWWNLMVESKVKNIKRQNCQTLRWKIRHRMAGPFNASTTKQTVSVKLQGKRDSESFLLSKDGE